MKEFVTSMRSLSNAEANHVVVPCNNPLSPVMLDAVIQFAAVKDNVVICE